MSYLVRQAVGLAAAIIGGFAVGYLAVTKVAPAVQAKIEAVDIDSVWELWDTEEWM